MLLMAAVEGSGTWNRQNLRLRRLGMSFLPPAWHVHGRHKPGQAGSALYCISSKGSIQIQLCEKSMG